MFSEPVLGPMEGEAEPAPNALQQKLIDYARSFPTSHWQIPQTLEYRKHYTDVLKDEKREGAMWATPQCGAIEYFAINTAQKKGFSICQLGDRLAVHPWLASGSDCMQRFFQANSSKLLNTSVDEHESCYNITFYTLFGRTWEIGFTGHNDMGWRHAWIMPKGRENTDEEGMIMVNLLCHLMGYIPIFEEVAGYFAQDKLAESRPKQMLAGDCLTCLSVTTKNVCTLGVGPCTVLL